MRTKMQSFRHAPDWLRKRSTVSFVHRDPRLNRVITKLLAENILNFEDLAKLRPSGLRRRFNVKEPTIRRIRSVFWYHGYWFRG